MVDDGLVESAAEVGVGLLENGGLGFELFEEFGWVGHGVALFEKRRNCNSAQLRSTCRPFGLGQGEEAWRRFLRSSGGAVNPKYIVIPCGPIGDRGHVGFLLACRWLEIQE